MFAHMYFERSPFEGKLAWCTRYILHVDGRAPLDLKQEKTIRKASIAFDRLLMENPDKSCSELS